MGSGRGIRFSPHTINEVIFELKKKTCIAHSPSSRVRYFLRIWVSFIQCESARP